MSFQDAPVYIDPSGQVETAADVPVAGAVLMLLRSATHHGSLKPVVDGSSTMSPANRHNPDTSGITGRFGWDVAPGYYQVTAAKTGCRAANGKRTQQTARFRVPPPVGNLVLRLRCRARRRTPTHTTLTLTKGLLGTAALRVAVTYASGRSRRIPRGRLVGTVTFRDGRTTLDALAPNPRTGATITEVPSTPRLRRTFTATFNGNALLINQFGLTSGRSVVRLWPRTRLTRTMR